MSPRSATSWRLSQRFRALAQLLLTAQEDVAAITPSEKGSSPFGPFDPFR
jgi:hypothetical protein